MSANSKSVSVADVLKLRPCVSWLVPVIAEGRCCGRSYVALPSGKALLEAAQASKQGNHLAAFVASVEATCYSAWNILGTLSSACDGDPKAIIINPIRSGILTAFALILVLFAFVGLLIQCDTLSWLIDDKTLLTEASTITDYKNRLSILHQTKHIIEKEIPALIERNRADFVNDNGSEGLLEQMKRDFVMAKTPLVIDGETFDPKTCIVDFVHRKLVESDPVFSDKSTKEQFNEVREILLALHQGLLTELSQNAMTYFHNSALNCIPSSQASYAQEGYRADVVLQAGRREITLTSNFVLGGAETGRSPQSGKFFSRQVSLGKLEGKVKIDLIANKATTFLQVTEVTN